MAVFLRLDLLFKALLLTKAGDLHINFRVLRGGALVTCVETIIGEVRNLVILLALPDAQNRSKANVTRNGLLKTYSDILYIVGENL